MEISSDQDLTGNRHLQGMSFPKGDSTDLYCYHLLGWFVLVPVSVKE